MEELKITLTIEEYTKIYWALMKMGYLLHWKRDEPNEESQSFYDLATKMISSVPSEWIDEINFEWCNW